MVRNIIPFGRNGAEPDTPSEADRQTAAEVVDDMFDAETTGTPAASPRSADHAEMESLWDALGALDAEDFADIRPAPRAFPARRTLWLATGAVAATLVAGFTGYLAIPQSYQTQVGEQKVVALADGSQVTLNTDSRISVWLHGQRRVELRQGEALFEVAHKADSAPFYVVSDRANIRVTGTKFNVRRFDDHVGVDLLQGHIRVSPQDAPDRFVALSAGQAVDVGADGRIGGLKVADAPAVADWTHHRLTFSDERLADAVARMNRYSKVRLQVDSASLQTLRVNGVFEAGDSSGFADALHGLYGVRVNRDADTISLASPVS